MKTYFIVLLSLCTYMGIAQSDSTATKTVTNEYWEYERVLHPAKFEIGGGFFIPQGKLATFIKPSPFIGVEIYIPTKRNKSITAVFQFVLPSQEDQFIIQNPNTIDGVEAVSSDLIINTFLRFSQNLTPIDSPSKLELGLGVGISTMLVQTPFSFFNDDDENASRGLVSFLIAPGLHWKFKPTKNSDLTIGADLQYSPYKLKGALEQDLGGLAISPKILYRF
ncbi:MAG: hypothetical protein ACI9Y7_000659 [Dokdonia sp.]|jgi:hypothetical protein